MSCLLAIALLAQQDSWDASYIGNMLFVHGHCTVAPGDRPVVTESKKQKDPKIWILDLGYDRKSVDDGLTREWARRSSFRRFDKPEFTEVHVRYPSGKTVKIKVTSDKEK